MHVPLEPFVPYDQSLQWRIHDSYYEKRGASAWTGGEIPYQSTSNYAIARVHAALLIEVVDELARTGRLAEGEEVYVLEIGSGVGRFAVEQSQLSVRSPFLDNDLVALSFRTPAGNEDDLSPSLQLIADGKPDLARIPNDRGITYPVSKASNRIGVKSDKR